MKRCIPGFTRSTPPRDAVDHPHPHPRADNPVLTVYDIDDVDDVRFVADPFLFKEDDGWYMFFEILPKDGKGHIGRALSKDGVNWEYDGVVIDSSEAGTHLSFPFVMKCGDLYYMLLDRGKKDYVPLYRSDDLSNWEEVNRYLEDVGQTYRDLGLIYYKDRWWLFAGTDDGGKFSGLRVYYSDEEDDIEDMDLHPHKNNPVVEGRPEAARPGGRFLVDDGGKIIAFFQDCEKDYGDKVRAYEITELSEGTYVDRPLEPDPLLEGTSSGWNAERMHHYDPWYVDGVCAVDGYDYSTMKKLMRYGERIPVLGKVIRFFNKRIGKVSSSMDTRGLYFSIGIYQVKK